MQRELTAPVALGGGQGTAALEVFRVGLDSGQVFFGTGAAWGAGGGIDTAGATGFVGSDATLGIAVSRVTDRTAADTRVWTGVTGEVSSLSVVGRSDIVAQVTRLSIRYNGASGDADGLPVSGDEASPISWNAVFSTGPPWSNLTGNQPLSIAGDIHIQVDGLLTASGSFFLDRVVKEGIGVVALTASHVTVWVGSDKGLDSSGSIDATEATGFLARSARLTLAWASGQARGDSRRWVGLALEAGSLEARGFGDAVSASVRDLTIGAATASGSFDGKEAAPMDWKNWLGMDSPVARLKGPQSLQVAGIVQFGLGGFVLLSSDFSLIHRRTEQVDISGGAGVLVDLDTLVMSMTRSSLFLGVGGRFAAEGSAEPLDLSGALGFATTGIAVDWAWSRVRNATAGDTRRWTGLVATAASGSALGLPASLVARLTAVGVYRNDASGTGGTGLEAVPLSWADVLGEASPLAVLDATEHQTVRGTLSLVMSDFVTVTGDFGLARSGADLVAVSSKASAFLTGGAGIRVGVDDAVVGLRWTADRKLALQASGGTADLDLGAGFVTAKASGAGVSWNNTGVSVDEVVTVGAGPGSLSAPLKVLDGMASVWVPGFEATVSRFVTLEGNVLFRRGPDRVLEALATGVSARLGVGDVIEAGLSGGQVGFIIDADGRLALAASGAPDLNLGSGIAVVGAASVSVSFNDTDGPVQRTLQGVVEGRDTEVELDLDVGVRLVAVEDLTATLGGGVGLRGDLALGWAEGALEGVGSDMSLLWDFGNDLALGLEDASVALIVEKTQGVAWRVAGTPRFPLPDTVRSAVDFTLRDLVFAYNSTGPAIERRLQVGSLGADLRTDSGSVENPFLAVTAGVGIAIADAIRLSGTAVFTRSLDTVSGIERLSAGIVGLNGTAGKDAYAITGGGLGLVFVPGQGAGGGLGLAVQASLKGRVVEDSSSAEIGIQYRRNSSRVPLSVRLTVGGDLAPVVFSDVEVLSPSGEVFSQFLAEASRIAFGDLVVMGTYPSTSTTPDGVSVTRVTGASIQFGEPALFGISADEFVYLSYSGGRTLGGVVYEGTVQQLQIEKGRIEIGKVLSLYGTFSLVRGTVVGDSAPRITLGFASAGIVVHKQEGGRWLEVTGNGSFGYVPGRGLSLDRFEVTRFDILPSEGGSQARGGVGIHGDGEAFDPATGDLVPGPRHLPPTLSVGAVTLQNPYLSVDTLDLALTDGGLARVSFNLHLGAASGSVKGLAGLGIKVTDSADADAFGLLGVFQMEVDLDPLRQMEAVRWGILGFQCTGDSVRVDLGEWVAFETQGTRLDLGAAADLPLLWVESATVIVTAGPLRISGGADRFSILGSGAFHAAPDFGVHLSVLPAAGKDLGMPSWMPVQIETLGLRWRSINEAPLDVVLTLSASVVGIEGLPGASFSGSIEGVQIDLGLLRQGRFPILELGGIGVTIEAQAFGGTIHGGLIGGLVRLDADGHRIGPDAPFNTPVADRVLYLGVQGGFEFAGLAGFMIRFAVSELGPLGVLVTAKSPVGIPIDPTMMTGLAIGNLTAGVEFYSTLPVITTAEELRRPGLSGREVISADQWADAIQNQVATQYRAIRDNPALGGFFSAFSAPMVITGAGRVFTNYLSQQTFNADLEIRISTDGRFLAIGTFNFLADSTSVAGRLYGDLGRIAKGEGRFLFLVTVPDQTELLELGGGLEFGFRNADGEEVVFGKPVTPTPGGEALKPAFDPVLATPDPGRILDVVQWGDSRSLGVRLVPVGGAAVGTIAWNGIPGAVSLTGPQGDAVSLGAPTEIRDGIATFHLPEGFLIQAGPHRVAFADRAFRNAEGVTSVATVRDFVVQGSRVDLSSIVLLDGLDVGVLNRDRAIDLVLTPTTGGTIDPASLLDSDVEFSLVVDGARIDLSAAPEVLPGSVYRYRLPDGVIVPVGRHQVVAAADSFKDTNGNPNLATTLVLAVHGVRMTMLGGFGAVVSADTLNRQGWLDVRITPSSGARLELGTVLDADPEWTLTGPGASGVTLLQSGVESLGGDVYRYRFSGRFTQGAVEFVTLKGSVLDSAGHGVLSTRTDLRIGGLHAELVEPGPSGILSVSSLQSTGRIRVRFTSPFGTDLDPASITDAAPELVLSGKAASKVALSGVGQRVEIDGQEFVDYAFTGTFRDGEVAVEVVPGSWSDSAGNLGQGTLFRFEVVPDASTFVLTLSGLVSIHAMGTTPDLNGDAVPDPILRVQGSATLAFLMVSEGASAQLNLSVVGTTELFGIGAVGSAVGSFTVALGSVAGGDGWMGGAFPAIWGGLRLQAGLGPNAEAIGVMVDAQTLLRFNSTGQDRIIELDPQGASAPEAITLRAHSFSLGGSGLVRLANSLTVQGSFDLEVGSSSASLALDGRAEMVLGEMTVLGRLTWVYGQGVHGVLSSASQMTLPGAALKGSFQMELNTTTTAREIPLLVVDASGAVTGTRSGMIDPQTFRVGFGGVLTVVGFVDLIGSARIELTPDRATLSLDMDLDLKGMGRQPFTSTAILQKETDGALIFALNAEVDLNLRFADSIGITANGQVHINTSRTTEHLGVAAATTLIDFSGTLKLLALRGEAFGRFESVDGSFNLEFHAGLGFFDVVVLSVDGSARSDGTFQFSGSAKVRFDLSVAKLDGRLDLEVTHKTFSLSIQGALDVRNPLAWIPGCKDWITLSSVRGDIQLGSSGARLAMSVVVLEVPLEFDFKWGTPPPAKAPASPLRGDWAVVASAGGGVRLVERSTGPIELHVDAVEVEIDLGRLGEVAARGLLIVGSGGASVIVRNTGSSSPVLARLGVEGVRDARLAGDFVVAGPVSIQASGSLTLERSLTVQSGGSLTLRGSREVYLSETGSIRLEDRGVGGPAGRLTVQGGLVDLDGSVSVGAGSVTVSAAQRLAVRGCVVAGGDLTLTGSTGVLVTASAQVQSGGFTGLGIESRLGAIELGDGASIRSATGIRLAARGDLTVSGVRGTSVSLESIQGAILDGGDQSPDVAADQVRIVSSTGVGLGSRGQIELGTSRLDLTVLRDGSAHIEVASDVMLESATLVGTGDLHLHSARGGIRIEDSVRVSRGDLVLEALDGLRNDGTVQASGRIRLVTGDPGVTGLDRMVSRAGSLRHEVQVVSSTAAVLPPVDWICTGCQGGDEDGASFPVGGSPAAWRAGKGLFVGIASMRRR